MSEWKTYKLRDVVNILDYKRIPLSSRQREQRRGKYPYYGAQGIIDYIDDYIFDGTYLLVAEDGENLRSKKQHIAQLVSGKYWVNNHAHILESNGLCDIRYICYLLNVFDISGYITGSAQPKLNQANLLAIEISLPPLAEQKRIADILSAIDDKIELNRRINANLEQQAQALYKSWFVDFEPFGGKMPEDWREGTLGEIAEFRRGKGILGKDTIKGNIPVVAGGLEPAYYHNLANTKAPVVTISASGANAGFMRMYNVDVWASDCSYIDSRCANLLWTYCYLKINAQLLKHAQTGAVQPHVKASDVNAFEIIIPTSENIINFQQKVKPFFEQIANNERENLHLAQLRDTLLPKLMSGEIVV